MKHLKTFENFIITEGYNLNTLKAYIDTDNKLYVKIKNSDDTYQVLDINVKSIHDGTLKLKSINTNKNITITHDDIVKSITEDELENTGS